MNVRVPKGHGVISLPEIGIEGVPKDPGTHSIGAIKHQGGIENRLPEKY
jgi:hypothetical protein